MYASMPLATINLLSASSSMCVDYVHLRVPMFFSASEKKEKNRVDYRITDDIFKYILFGEEIRIFIHSFLHIFQPLITQLWFRQLKGTSGMYEEQFYIQNFIFGANKMPNVTRINSFKNYESSKFLAVGTIGQTRSRSRKLVNKLILSGTGAKMCTTSSKGH